MARHCSNCGSKENATYTCICGEVFYCNTICQKADWKRHRSTCPPYSVKNISGKGLGLVATRGLAPGVIIMKETPVIVVNKIHSHYTQIIKLFENLPEAQKRGILGLFDPGVDYKREIMKGVQSTLGFGEESMKVVRIFSANSIDVCSHAELEINDSALYQNISRINHSCAPNCVWSWKKDDLYVKEVRAVRKIEKGSEILASYLAGDDVMSRDERKPRLAIGWNFNCSCQVCGLTEEELEENEELRSQIRKHHTDVADLAARGNLFGALTAAKKKLNLMLKIKDEVILEMPSALMECFELSCALGASSTRRRGDLFQKNQHGKDKDEYKNEAFEMANKFGDCFMHNFHSKVKKCQLNYS